MGYKRPATLLIVLGYRRPTIKLITILINWVTKETKEYVSQHFVQKISECTPHSVRQLTTITASITNFITHLITHLINRIVLKTIKLIYNLQGIEAHNKIFKK